jgi:hypothetical protein
MSLPTSELNGGRGDRREVEVGQRLTYELAFGSLGLLLLRIGLARSLILPRQLSRRIAKCPS